MSHVNGIKVVLDLEALQSLCAQCMSAIEEQQEAVLQMARCRVCESGSEVKNHLPALETFQRRAMTGYIGVAE